MQNDEELYLEVMEEQAGVSETLNKVKKKLKEKEHTKVEVFTDLDV